MQPHSSTILVVEDNPDDALLIRRAFGKAEVQNPIQIVDDGEKAIAYLNGEGEFADRERYPLPLFILLDLKLPRRSGHEVLKWIRGQETIRGIPVVILTSSAEQSDVSRVYELGANSYLVKPVEFDDLLELTRRLNIYWVRTNRGPYLSH